MEQELAEESTALVEDGDTADESQAEESGPPVEDDVDSALAKQLNVDRLPDDPEEIKRLALKRTRELREMGRKSSEAKKAKMESKIEELAASIAELRESRKAPEAPVQTGPPTDATDEEILDYYIDRRMEQKYGSKLSAIDRLVEIRATEMIETARSKYGDDFDQNQAEIEAALQRFPGMNLDEAVAFVTAPRAKESARRDLETEQQQRIAAKKGAGSIQSPGTPSSGLREPDPATTSSRDYMAWAKEAAREQLRREGIPVED